MKQYQLTKNRQKRQSFKKILFGSVVFVGLSIGSAPNRYAIFGIGDIVYDPPQLAETMLQYALQGAQWIMQKLQYVLQQVQHAMQKLQYAAQLRNLLELVAFIWTRAHDIYDTVNRLDNVHSIYQLVYGSTEAMMNNVQSTVDFLEKPCTAFKPAFGQDITGWCHYPDPNKGIYALPLTHIASKSTSGGGIVVSDVQPSSLFSALPQNTPSLLYNITSNANINANIDAAALNTLQEQVKDSAALTKLNTSEIQFNLQQQSDLQNEANNIDNIQNLQTTGNLQALQKQNQLTGNIATQLMKIHALILARNSAEAQKREEETQEKAKAETFYYQVFLTDSYAPMKKHVWK
ncbi:MAG: hypothetical protein J6V89_03790 [Acetobacter sp.]|nr:hypothetical protein [Acetobacter sp.]